MSELIDLDKLINNAGAAIAEHFGAGEPQFGYDVDLSAQGEVLIHTDIVQRVAGPTRTQESLIAAQSEEVLGQVGHGYLRSITNERFLNFSPTSLCAEQGVLFVSSQALPRRIFAIRPPLEHHGRARLAARIAVQLMAISLIDDQASTELMVETPEELEKLALRTRPSLSAEASDLSTCWIFPQSAPKDILSRTLRSLGIHQRALVESITSDEWGEIDGFANYKEFSLGQRIALAEFGLLGELDLVGSGRQEVQNLPWLISTVVQRLKSILSDSGIKPEEGDESPMNAQISERWLFEPVMRNLAMRQVVLRGAARGRVCVYLGFWREIAQSTLKLINDPTFRRSAASGSISRIDSSCSWRLMSVLSETVATWENHLHRELTLP